MTIRYKYIIAILLFGVLLFTAACDSVSDISLNVKRPARIAFPKYVDNVVIVNNAGFQPNDEGHTFYSDRTEEKNDISTDSLSALMCRFLWENVAEQNFFSEVNFYNIPVREDDEHLSVKPISSLKINDIVEQTQADAIISLDYFYVKSLLSVKKFENYGIFEAVCEISVQMQPTVYIPGETGKSMVLVDTVFWESYGLNSDEALAGLPYLDDAVFVAVERAGETAGKALVPHEQIENRRYYASLSGDMHKAANAAIGNDWDKALNIWISVYEKSKKLNVRARCAANIALAYEIRDDYLQAEEWAIQAHKEFVASGSAFGLNQSRYLESYINRLKRRKIESTLLDIQE